MSVFWFVAGPVGIRHMAEALWSKNESLVRLFIKGNNIDEVD